MGAFKKFVPFFIWLLSTGLSPSLYAECHSATFPLKFDRYGIPAIEVSLQGISFTALLDLGSDMGIHIAEDDIKKLKGIKYTAAIRKSMNINGEIFRDKVLTINAVHLGCITLKNVSALIKSDWAVSAGDDSLLSLQKGDIDLQLPNIIIGRGLFNKKMVIIDYPHQRVTIYNDGYGASNSVQQKAIAADFSSEGVSLKLNSEHKSYSMILDTGSNLSFFAANKVDKREKIKPCHGSVDKKEACKSLAGPFLLPNKTEYRTPIYLYDIDERFSHDGLLGGDFFNHFIVTIDFNKKKVFLAKAPKSMN